MIASPRQQKDILGDKVQRNYVLIGPQGSGKGTQAKLIAKKYSIPHISTGDIFREMKHEQTALGKKVRELMDKGNLIPDEITNQIVAQRILKPDCENGFVLDGYPRNLVQAEFLGQKKPVSKCIYIEISDSEAVKRISARLVCSVCKADYNTIYIKPRKAGACDRCNGKLIQREDDKPEFVKKRLETFHRETRPLLDYYEKQGVLLKVNGAQAIDKVFADVVNGLQQQ
jgi:adenylate kinase